jgi:quercetin dioxygenase-like cupin family protein
MRAEVPGITPARSGLEAVVWNVLGQIYVPKQVTDDSFAWHATFPVETFVPPHTHTTRDEYILALGGRIDLLMGGERMHAGTGDVVRMPRGIPHAFFNNSGEPVAAHLWAAPARRLAELYPRLHNVADSAEVVRIAREYDVFFQPPVSAAAHAPSKERA